jgi:hypothetical protein
MAAELKPIEEILAQVPSDQEVAVLQDSSIYYLVLNQPRTQGFEFNLDSIKKIEDALDHILELSKGK